MVGNRGAGHAFPTGISIRNAILVIEVELDGQLLPQIDGPTVPFYASAGAGQGPDDLAGRPGRGFARVLEGRINGQGPVVRPVLFIDAEGVYADTRIASGAEDLSHYRFLLPVLPDGLHQATVRARLLYRRAWRELAQVKGWTVTPAGGPIEIEIAQQTLTLALGPSGPIERIPALNRWAVVALALLTLLAALATHGPGLQRPENRH